MGVFFFYELSPIKVELQERRPAVLHFLTSVCAIIGGVFTARTLAYCSPRHRMSFDSRNEGSECV